MAPPWFHDVHACRIQRCKTVTTVKDVTRMRLRIVCSRLAIATAAILLTLAILPGCGFGGADDSTLPVSDLSSELDEEAQGLGTPDDPAVFVKSGQDSYHTRGCKWLSRGRPGVDALTESEAKSQGYTPCQECIGQES